MKLTKEQAKNILEKSYGISDSFANVYFYNPFAIEDADEEFKENNAALTTADGYDVEYISLLDAELDENGGIYFTKEGERELFNVLVALGTKEDLIKLSNN